MGAREQMGSAGVGTVPLSCVKIRAATAHRPQVIMSRCMNMRVRLLSVIPPQSPTNPHKPHGPHGPAQTRTDPHRPAQTHTDPHTNPNIPTYAPGRVHQGPALRCCGRHKVNCPHWARSSTPAQLLMLRPRLSPWWWWYPCQYLSVRREDVGTGEREVDTTSRGGKQAEWDAQTKLPRSRCKVVHAGRECTRQSLRNVWSETYLRVGKKEVRYRRHVPSTQGPVPPSS
jgi:hypothetical protein